MTAAQRQTSSTTLPPEPSPGAGKESLARPSAEGSYDLAIIGSGSAAFAAAITARELGARVVMIERGTIGGTCVNIGCVPSKLLLRAAEMRYQAGHQPYHGIETAAGGVDLGKLVGQKDALTAALRQTKYLDLIGAYGWELVRGEARFLDNATLAVGEQTIQARAYLIASGANPSVPAIPGLREAGYLTSTTAMAVDRLPASVVVIGAGYVALELGQILRQLGSEVTLLQRGSRLLPAHELEVSEAAGQMLDRLGTRVMTGAQVRRVASTGSGRRLVITRAGREETLAAEQILVATGRQPNTAALCLTAAGVRVDQRGAPILDEQLRTTNPRIFAAGDVTLAPQFVYVAAYEGQLAARNAVSSTHQAIALRAVPSVIFTDPQIAAVGLTSAQAAEQGYAIQRTALPISTLARAQVNNEREGVITLVAEATTGRLLGAEMVASHAGEAIYAATLAVRYGLTIAQLVDSFAPYLTMAEGLKLAALAFDRDVDKLSCCAA